jgi:hypothetical protein
VHSPQTREDRPLDRRQNKPKLSNLFNRHVSKDRIDLALEQLTTLGLINHETSYGRGRPSTLWAKQENPKTADTET